jgi:hypothetical protein
MMATKHVRKSIQAQAGLIKEFLACAKEAGAKNFNQAVKLAMEAFIADHRNRAIEEGLKRMAADPVIQDEFKAIQAMFRVAEGDGL